jgi:hypothetical protein
VYIENFDVWRTSLGGLKGCSRFWHFLPPAQVLAGPHSGGRHAFARFECFSLLSGVIWSVETVI